MVDSNHRPVAAATALTSWALAVFFRQPRLEVLPPHTTFKIQFAPASLKPARAFFAVDEVERASVTSVGVFSSDVLLQATLEVAS